MGKKIIKGYYKLFDEKLGSGVITIFIITFLITSIGNITYASQNHYSSEQEKLPEIVVINGKTYKLLTD